MKVYLLLALGIFFLGQGSDAQILLKNATIINGDAAVKPRKGSLLIRGTQIEKVIDDPSAVPEGVARVIDCTGKFITPGLMDAHVHLGTIDMHKQKVMHAKTDSILENMLRHGITSVRDMAGDAIFLAEYKRAIATGQLAGPDIFYAAQFAGPGYFALMKRSSSREEGLGTTPWYCAITPQTDLRLAVAEAKGAGVTGIKIYADLTQEQIVAITKEAHAQGLQAWSHGAVFPAKPIDAALAGVNSMSHAGDFVFQQLSGDTLNNHEAWKQLYNKSFRFDSTAQVKLLQTMQQRGIFLDPTIFNASNNKFYNAFTVTRMAHRLGVKIVTGTDWFYSEKNEPVPLMEEMLLLVSKCGLTIPEVIQCATLNSATATGLHDRGQIREGALADLIITRTNPYTNLPALFQPEMVMKKGKVLQW